jgi:hypothetical protein
MIERFNPKLAKLIFKVKNFTDFAVAYRYPDAEKKPISQAQSKKAIMMAQKIYDTFHLEVFGKIPKI